METSKYLLYIDDSEIDHKIIARHCSRFQIPLITVFFAEDGLEIIKTNPPSLILCDINLHGLDGWDFVQIARCDPVTAQIPVILVTAYQFPGLIENGAAAGALGTLIKPLNPGYLEKLFRTYLRLTG